VVAVSFAEDLNFSRAAKRLGISQPPLSKQVGALEAALGVKLFQRGSHGVSLTPAGRALLVEAYRLLDQTEQIWRSVTKVGQEEHGTLTIAAVSTAFHLWIPKLLDAFRIRFPHVTISLKECTSIEAVLALRRSEVDIAFAFAERIPSPLQPIELFHDRCSVALPKHHRLANRDIISLADLADDAFVLFRRQCSPKLHDAILQAFHDAEVRPSILHESSSIAAQLDIVASGYAVALVPRSIQGPSSSLVKYVELKDDIPLATLKLIWNDQTLSGLVEQFVNIATPKSTYRLP